MAKRKPPKKDRGDQQARRAARRDVRLSLRPELQAINRQERGVKRDYRTMAGQAEGIYDALGNELAPLGPAYQEQAQGISSGLEQALADLASSLGLQGMDTPQGETQAALGAYGSVGAGGLSQLASQMQRNLGYQTSASRQGAIERETVGRNLLEDLQNALEGLGERRLDVTSNMGAMVRQRMDELAEQALTEELARSQMASDAAFSQYLQGSIGDMLGGPGGPGGPGGNQNAPSYTGNPPPRGPGGAGPDLGAQEFNAQGGIGDEPYGPPTAGLPPIVRRWLAGNVSWQDLNRRQRRRVRQNTSGIPNYSTWSP